MASASRSQVTITLGRSGQVVRRDGHAADMSFSDSQPTAGKRSVKDRLGGVVDESTQLNIKRQRGESSRLTLNAASMTDDLPLTEHDLRFKIMQKNLLRRSQSSGHKSGVDLRDKFPRSSQYSLTSLSMQQRSSSELKDSRHCLPEPKDVRSYRLGPDSALHYRPEPKDGRNYRPEPKDGRNYRPETMESRPYRSEPMDVRHRLHEAKSSSVLGGIPPSRYADALPIESSRNSYSPWTLDRLRRRSPDGISVASRALSPQLIDDEIQRRSGSRRYDNIGMIPYKSVHEPSRPVSSAPYTSKAISNAKPLISVLPPPPPTSSVLQKCQPTFEGQHTIEGFLRSLGLERHAISFKVEEVDMHALSQMEENDLKEMGIPMGPRKKILLALGARSRRQA